MSLTTKLYPGCHVFGPYFNKEKGRYYVQIMREGHHVQSMNLARFVMQERQGRILEYHEHVDHIDDNKTNDVITNLQILTQAENNQKSQIKYPEFKLETCLECEEVFKMDRAKQRTWNYRRKHGAVGPFCCVKHACIFVQREGV